MRATILLNFGHVVRTEVIEGVEAGGVETTPSDVEGTLAPGVLESVGMTAVELIYIPLQVDMDPGATPTPEQIKRVLNTAAYKCKKKGAALDGTYPVVVALPGMTEAVALILAQLHGRLGRWPKILALRRNEDGTYSLADQRRYPGMEGGVLDLERIRMAAREAGRHYPEGVPAWKRKAGLPT